MPEGFEVSLYADDELAHDIYSMTIDAHGRVVVAGAGYVKILHDTDGDGRADRATLFSSLPASGAHGMFFDGPDLICTGDNCGHAAARHRRRRRGRRRAGSLDRAAPSRARRQRPRARSRRLLLPDLRQRRRRLGEANHDAPTSPVKHPRCGGIVRFSPEGKPLDVLPTAFAIPTISTSTPPGHLFTVDSDGERDHHLPWYAPTRLFDVAQGMEHGWLLQGWTRGWNRPRVVLRQRRADGRDRPRLADRAGRLSPSRVSRRIIAAAFFRPAGRLGRVYLLSARSRRHRPASSKLEISCETTGDVGFAPCDLAVGPEGDLFVAIGGRRTRGSVFRVAL